MILHKYLGYIQNYCKHLMKLYCQIKLVSTVHIIFFEYSKAISNNIEDVFLYHTCTICKHPHLLQLFVKIFLDTNL